MATNLKTLARISTNPSVSNEGLASYLRITPDAEAIAECEALRAMADQAASEQTGRAILNTRYLLALPNWPRPVAQLFHRASKLSRTIELPRSPLVSVASVKYYDTEGTLMTLSTDDYIVVTSYEPGLVYLKEGSEWPELYDRPDAVQIEFIAGPGEATSDANPVLVQAIKLLARHFYSGGTPNLVDTEDGMTAQNLLLSQRVSGFIK